MRTIIVAMTSLLAVATALLAIPGGERDDTSGTVVRVTLRQLPQDKVPLPALEIGPDMAAAEPLVLLTEPFRAEKLITPQHLVRCAVQALRENDAERFLNACANMGDRKRVRFEHPGEGHALSVG